MAALNFGASASAAGSTVLVVLVLLALASLGCLPVTDLKSPSENGADSQL